MPIGGRREGSLAEVPVHQPAEDVVASLPSPSNQVLGVDEDPPVVAGDAAACSAVAAIGDFPRIVVVADVGLAKLGHRQDGLVRASPSRKATLASHPSAPLAREKSARE